MNGIDARLIVVTGASRGIGRDIALLLAAEGARLIVTGRDARALESLADASDGKVIGIVPGDVADGRVALSCRDIADAAGGANALVNAAGVFPTALLPDISDVDAIRTMETNFFGVLRFCRAFLPGMAARGGGSVVNITSLAARSPTPGLSVYAASKAAVEAFSRAIAAEYAPHVRVNCLSPGPTWTDSVADLAASDTTGAVDAVTRAIPMGRYGAPAEIAAAARFLIAGAGSSWMTGQTLHVNGGALMV